MTDGRLNREINMHYAKLAAAAVFALISSTGPACFQHYAILDPFSQKL